MNPQPLSLLKVSTLLVEHPVIRLTLVLHELDGLSPSGLSACTLLQLVCGHWTVLVVGPWTKVSAAHLGSWPSVAQVPRPITMYAADP